MITINLKTIKVVEDEQIIYFIKDENHWKDSICKRSNETLRNDEEYNNTIVELKESGEVIIYNIIFTF